MRKSVASLVAIATCALGCGSNQPVPESPDATAMADATADRTAEDTGPFDASSPDGARATDVTAVEAADADSAGPPPDASPGEGGADAAPRTCEPHCADVVTWHNDGARSGLNLRETVLTPANVNSTTFGKLFVLPVDGKVDAQPLVVSALDVVGKGTHDVVFVATEHGSLYAFDGNGNTGPNASPLWRVSLLGTGETPSDNPFGCGQVIPEIGITSTPVIDLSTSTLYAVAMSKSGATYFQRLHAIDIASGAERAGSPVDIHASYPGMGLDSVDGSDAFDPGTYKERAGLVLLNGAVYLTWASHCDQGFFTGWVMAYDSTTLRQTAVLDITPNGNGGANWAAGAAPATDESGNIYFLDGNGPFDTTLDSRGFPAQGDFGNAMLKISTAGPLTVADYFAPWDTIAQSARDLDFGSGGVMLLPDDVGSATHPHLAVGAGKDTNLYLVDRDDLGKWNGVDGGTDNHQIVQEIPGVFVNGVYSSPAYFDHAIYYGSRGAVVMRFVIQGGQIAMPPASISDQVFTYPGTTPSISANGAAANPAATAIVWAAEDVAPAVLHAFAASDLKVELYSSRLVTPAGRDSFGDGNKFIVPTIANGHVYVGTTSSVGVFGLLP